MKSDLLVIFSQHFKLHNDDNHIENKGRVEVIENVLRNYNTNIITPNLLNESEFLEILKICHSEVYIKEILNFFEQANRLKRVIYIDPDTYISPNSKEACLACVFSIVILPKVLRRYNSIFIPTRPPGHHSGRNGWANHTLGFCIFNNAGIAAYLLKEYWDKILILDIDLHHGNGTENIVKNDSTIKFISLHARDIYPFTGYKSYANIVNIALDRGITDKDYIKIFKNKVIKEIENFCPDIVLVSLGFDAHKEDMLSPLNITFKSYKFVFNFLKNYKVVFFLEGGYNPNVLEKGVSLLFDIFSNKRKSQAKEYF